MANSHGGSATNLPVTGPCLRVVGTFDVPGVQTTLHRKVRSRPGAEGHGSDTGDERGCPRWRSGNGRWPDGRCAACPVRRATDACYQAADQAVQTHGGFGYAREFHVERYWREARLQRIAPISQEMVLNYVSEHVHGLPRSY